MNEAKQLLNEEMPENDVINFEELDANIEEDKKNDQADDLIEKMEESATAKLEATIVELKNKITELEAMRSAQERILEEIGDFTALFPEAKIEDIPESVWESVKSGVSLSASYALYTRRLEAEAARIAQINSANASSSAGKAGKNTANEYFSPDEVRKMSRSEVHANYSKIKESMKKWINSKNIF